MLGLKRGTVKLSPHQPEWSQLFIQEKDLLSKKLGKHIVAIEHVGSTAIPGIPSKPIIDINLSISPFNNVHLQELVPFLKTIGYTYMHEFTHRYFFAKGPEESRTHHLNLVALDSAEWKNSILFRDYLRRHQKEREEYAQLKTELAQKFSQDRPSYTSAKEIFIEDIIKKAESEN